MAEGEMLWEQRRMAKENSVMEAPMAKYRVVRDQKDGRYQIESLVCVSGVGVVVVVVGLGAVLWLKCSQCSPTDLRRMEVLMAVAQGSRLKGSRTASVFWGATQVAR